MSPWPNLCTTPTGTRDNSISSIGIIIPSPSESHTMSASFNLSCLFYIHFFSLLDKVSHYSLLPLARRILWTQIKLCTSLWMVMGRLLLVIESWGMNPYEIYLLLISYLVGRLSSPLVELFAPYHMAHQFNMDLHPAKRHETILVSS